MTTLQQIELIKNLDLKPDVIINIKVRIVFFSIVNHSFYGSEMKAMFTKF